MSIKEFHAMLQTAKSGSRFEALRRLAAFENPRDLVRKDDNLIFFCWPVWHVSTSEA